LVDYRNEGANDMTNLYEMTLTVSIKVEANDIREARKEITKLANDFIATATFQDGVSMEMPNHSDVNLI
jgi:hypothetical protein